MTNNAFYVTTPIYYVNDNPHIGHAYTSIACDVSARFYRLKGQNVKFLTGTDEHGQKVAKAAEKKNIDPQTLVDQVSQNFQALTPLLNLSNDDFIRTTQDRHKKAAQHIWQTLLDKGHIYLSKYSGWYAVRDEAFYTEDELTENNSGTKIAPTGAEVEWVEEESYFFDLSKWQDKLLSYYQKHPEFVSPAHRLNEVISFVKSGLRDLSISRTTFNWGISVPNDTKHVMYVWIEALTNYITALGYPDMNNLNFKTFWPAATHFVGKDILRFHAVYWPAFLMAADIPLPQQIVAHGWWTIEGQKMSKSLGNVHHPKDIVDSYGVDSFRYFLMREISFGQDGDFSKEAICQRINSDLANNIGNLTQRVASFAFKNCDQAVPEGTNLTADDLALLTISDSLLEKLEQHMQTFAFHKMLQDIIELGTFANKYVDQHAPWQLRKEDPERMKVTLYVLLETIRNIAITLLPFIPESAHKILDVLSVPHEKRNFTYYGTHGRLKPGEPLKKPEPIFMRQS